MIQSGGFIQERIDLRDHLRVRQSPWDGMKPPDWMITLLSEWGPKRQRLASHG